MKWQDIKPKPNRSRWACPQAPTHEQETKNSDVCDAALLSIMSIRPLALRQLIALPLRSVSTPPLEVLGQVAGGPETLPTLRECPHLNRCSSHQPVEPVREGVFQGSASG